MSAGTRSVGSLQAWTGVTIHHPAFCDAAAACMCTQRDFARSAVLAVQVLRQGHPTMPSKLKPHAPRSLRPSCSLRRLLRSLLLCAAKLRTPRRHRPSKSSRHATCACGPWSRHQRRPWSRHARTAAITASPPNSPYHPTRCHEMRCWSLSHRGADRAVHAAVAPYMVWFLTDVRLVRQSSSSAGPMSARAAAPRLLPP